MKVIIHTQFMENYGAHDWDGTGECPQYWKYKGGDTFVIRDIDVNDAMSMNETMEKIKSFIEYESDYAREYVIDWNIEDDDCIECEEWETPWDICIDTMTASRFVKADEWWKPGFVGKQESYAMMPAGERDKYVCDYIKEGEVAA
jgi:hypothetical protein